MTLEEAKRLVEETAHDLASAKPPEPAHPQCPVCGRFTSKVEPNDKVYKKPPGWFCAPCNWHSAKKRVWGHFVPVPLQQLLQVAPENIVARTQLHAITRIPPPDAIKDYDGLVNWFEFEAEIPQDPDPFFKARPASYRRGAGAGGAGVDFRGHAEETAYGSCHFRERRYGEATYTLPAADILDQAARSRDMQDFWRRMEQFAVDMVSDDPPNMDSSDDPDHDHYDTEDCENFGAHLVHATQIRDLLSEFLYHNNRALYDRLSTAGVVLEAASEDDEPDEDEPDEGGGPL